MLCRFRVVGNASIHALSLFKSTLFRLSTRSCFATCCTFGFLLRKGVMLRDWVLISTASGVCYCMVSFLQVSRKRLPAVAPACKSHIELRSTDRFCPPTDPTPVARGWICEYLKPCLIPFDILHFRLMLVPSTPRVYAFFWVFPIFSMVDFSALFTEVLTAVMYDFMGQRTDGPKTLRPLVHFCRFHI